MLQRTVRTAAALAQSDSDFLDRLRDAGLRVRERHGDDGTLVGYSVALPGDRADRGSRPVWFAGSTLAYDLSLPRVRERFTPHVAPPRTGRERSTGSGRPPHCWAAPDKRRVPVMSPHSATSWPSQPHTPGACPRPGPGGCRCFRAGRPRPRRPGSGGPRPGWRASTRALEHAPRVARGGGAAVVLTLLIALVEAVEGRCLASRAGVPGAGESRRRGGRAGARGRRPCGYPAPAAGDEVPYRPGDAHRGPWPADGRTRYRCTGPPASRSESAVPAGSRPHPLTTTPRESLLMTSGYPPLPEPVASQSVLAGAAVLAYRRPAAPGGRLCRVRCGVGAAGVVLPELVVGGCGEVRGGPALRRAAWTGWIAAAWWMAPCAEEGATMRSMSSALAFVGGVRQARSMTTAPRPPRLALDPDETRELDQLTQKVEEAAATLDQARAALSEAAGRIAAGYERGGPAAVAAQVGWSRQHVSTLAAAHRRRDCDDQQDAA